MIKVELTYYYARANQELMWAINYAIFLLTRKE